MKKVFLSAAAALLTFSISSSAFAHSHLGGSNPADGEVVTTPVNEIVLEFDGEIEEGSFIDLTSTSGQAIEIQDISIGEGTLTGTIAEALPNDDYQVKWSIVSADGHPSEGEFSFSVNAPVPEVAEEAAEQTVEEPAEPETTEAAEDTTEVAGQSTEEQEVASADDVDEEESSSSTGIFIVLLAIIVAVGLFFFMKRKKK